MLGFARKQLKHCIPIAAHFDWALAVTMSAPAAELAPRVAPGLRLDDFEGQGFLAVACVKTRRLRPAFLPAFVGTDFFLVGYRIFVRYKSPRGRSYRGLQILRSETDRRLMVLGGRILTHYGYRHAAVEVNREPERLRVSTSSGLTVDVRLDLPELPQGSVFENQKQARRYAGPMPHTFASEDGGRSVLRVEGVRRHWDPKPVMPVDVSAPFLADLLPDSPVPASAFLVEHVDYRWKSGVREAPGA